MVFIPKSQIRNTHLLLRCKDFISIKEHRLTFPVPNSGVFVWTTRGFLNQHQPFGMTRDDLYMRSIRSLCANRIRGGGEILVF